MNMVNTNSLEGKHPLTCWYIHQLSHRSDTCLCFQDCQMGLQGIYLSIYDLQWKFTVHNLLLKCTHPYYDLQWKFKVHSGVHNLLPRVKPQAITEKIGLNRKILFGSHRPSFSGNRKIDIQSGEAIGNRPLHVLLTVVCLVFFPTLQFAIKVYSS